jgi:hypothetical protein
MIMQYLTYKHIIFLYCICFFSVSAIAQVPGRILFNSDFEIPVLTPASPSPPRQSCSPATACWYLVPENSVPGWNVVDVSTTSTDVINDNVEFWNSGFSGVLAQSGTQFIELNADRPTPVFFEICMFAGETLTWSLWHRGRNGTDQMFLNVTDALGVNLATQTFSTANTDWVNYTGTVTNTGPNGAVRFTFTPGATSGGNPTVGNFIDNIQVLGLRPLVEFEQVSYSAVESTVAPPRLLVNGTIPAGGVNVLLSVTGGTATGGGVDYTLNTTVNIPAGNYDGTVATSVPLNLTINDDLLVELGGETINISIVSADNPLLVNDANCGGGIQSTTTYRIIDNDTVLPVELLNFWTENLTSTVKLFWTTTQEQHSDYFEVQWSKDGHYWVNLGTVKASKESNTLKKYSFEHIEPQNTTYYRLKMIDLDKSYTYSKIITANKVYDFQNNILVYPNPVTKGEKLHITLPTDVEQVQIEMADILGKKYVEYLFANPQKDVLITMPTNSGIYILSISYGDKVIKQKIMVQ